MKEEPIYPQDNWANSSRDFVMNSSSNNLKLDQPFDKFFTQQLVEHQFSNAVIGKTIVPSHDKHTFAHRDTKISNTNSDDHRVLSYDLLDKYASSLAQYLKKKYADRQNKNGVIAIYLGRTIDSVAALLAVMKSGFAFQLLDELDTTEHSTNALNRFSSFLSQHHEDYPLIGIITSRPLWSRVNDVFQASNISIAKNYYTIYLDDLLTSSLKYDREAQSSSSNDGVAYVEFSSGTTSTPKGILIPHSGLVARLISHYQLFANNQYTMSKSSQVALHAQFRYDASIMEIMLGLGCGACVHVIDECVRRDVKLLVDYYKKNDITTAILVPSDWQTIDEYCCKDPSYLPKLKQILTTGEEADSDLILRWCQKALIINGYGPTEMSIGITLCAITAKNIAEMINADIIEAEKSKKLVSIGTPMLGTRLLIVKHHPNPQGGRLHYELEQPLCVYAEISANNFQVLTNLPMVDGEIIAIDEDPKIRSRSLGYTNNKELIKLNFISIKKQQQYYSVCNQDDPNAMQAYRTGDRVCLHQGKLYFLSRYDNQIKKSGQLIHLEEIQAVLCQSTTYQGIGIKSVNVKYRKGDKQITANLNTTLPVPDNLHESLFLHVRNQAAKSLFLFMLPGLWGLNGNELQYIYRVETSEQTTEYDPLIKKCVIEAWLAVFDDLDPDKLNVETNFDELGGDSLKYTQMLLKLKMSLSQNMHISEKVFNNGIRQELLTKKRLGDFIATINSVIKLSRNYFNIISKLHKDHLANKCIYVIKQPFAVTQEPNAPLMKKLSESWNVNEITPPYEEDEFFDETDIDKTIQWIIKPLIKDIKKNDNSPVILLGHSSGGTIAYHLGWHLAKHHSRETCVILLDTPSSELPQKISNEHYKTYLDKCIKKTIKHFNSIYKFTIDNNTAKPHGDDKKALIECMRKLLTNSVSDHCNKLIKEHQSNKDELQKSFALYDNSDVKSYLDHNMSLVTRYKIDQRRVEKISTNDELFREIDEHCNKEITAISVNLKMCLRKINIISNCCLADLENKDYKNTHRLLKVFLMSSKKYHIKMKKYCDADEPNQHRLLWPTDTLANIDHCQNPWIHNDLLKHSDFIKAPATTESLDKAPPRTEILDTVAKQIIHFIDLNEKNYPLTKNDKNIAEALQRIFDEQLKNSKFEQHCIIDLLHNKRELRDVIREDLSKEQGIKGTNRTLLIHGDAGMGKTFFMLSLARHYWSKYDIDTNSSILPIYVDLKELFAKGFLERNEPGSFFKYFYECFPTHFNSHQVTNPYDLQRFLRRSNVVYLVDGCDEISYEHLINKNLYDYCVTTHPGIEKIKKVIYTCRTEALPDARAILKCYGFIKDGITIECERYQLEPLNDDQINLYLKTYLEKNKKIEAIDDYKQWLFGLPGIDDIKCNPLLLRILVEILPHIAETREMQTNSIGRSRIYALFIIQWLLREHTKKSEKPTALYLKDRAIYYSIIYMINLAITLWNNQLHFEGRIQSQELSDEETLRPELLKPNDKVEHILSLILETARSTSRSLDQDPKTCISIEGYKEVAQYDQISHNQIVAAHVNFRVDGKRLTDEDFFSGKFDYQPISDAWVEVGDEKAKILRSNRIGFIRSRALLKVCSITIDPNSANGKIKKFKFMHKSIAEYLTGECIVGDIDFLLAGIQANGPDKVDYLINKKSLRYEPNMIRMIVEGYSIDLQKSIRVQKQLWSIVYATRTSTQLGMAASNALTIIAAINPLALNNRDLSFCCLHHVDLSQVHCQNTNFNGADISNAWFNETDLVDASMMNAKLSLDDDHEAKFTSNNTFRLNSIKHGIQLINLMGTTVIVDKQGMYYEMTKDLTDIIYQCKLYDPLKMKLHLISPGGLLVFENKNPPKSILRFFKIIRPNDKNLNNQKISKPLHTLEFETLDDICIDVNESKSLVCFGGATNNTYYLFLYSFKSGVLEKLDKYEVFVDYQFNKVRSKYNIIISPTGLKIALFDCNDSMLLFRLDNSRLFAIGSYKVKPASIERRLSLSSGEFFNFIRIYNFNNGEYQPDKHKYNNYLIIDEKPDTMNYPIYYVHANKIQSLKHISMKDILSFKIIPKINDNMINDNNAPDPSLGDQVFIPYGKFYSFYREIDNIRRNQDIAKDITIKTVQYNITNESDLFIDVSVSGKPIMFKTCDIESSNRNYLFLNEEDCISANNMKLFQLNGRDGKLRIVLAYTIKTPNKDATILTIFDENFNRINKFSFNSQAVLSLFCNAYNIGECNIITTDLSRLYNNMLNVNINQLQMGSHNLLSSYSVYLDGKLYVLINNSNQLIIHILSYSGELGIYNIEQTRIYQSEDEIVFFQLIPNLRLVIALLKSRVSNISRVICMPIAFFGAIIRIVDDEEFDNDKPVNYKEMIIQQNEIIVSRNDSEKSLKVYYRGVLGIESIDWPFPYHEAKDYKTGEICFNHSLIERLHLFIISTQQRAISMLYHYLNKNIQDAMHLGVEPTINGNILFFYRTSSELINACLWNGVQGIKIDLVKFISIISATYKHKIRVNASIFFKKILGTTICDKLFFICVVPLVIDHENSIEYKTETIIYNASDITGKLIKNGTDRSNEFAISSSHDNKIYIVTFYHNPYARENLAPIACYNCSPLTNQNDTSNPCNVIAKSKFVAQIDNLIVSRRLNCIIYLDEDPTRPTHEPRLYRINVVRVDPNTATLKVMICRTFSSKLFNLQFIGDESSNIFSVMSKKELIIYKVEDDYDSLQMLWSTGFSSFNSSGLRLDNIKGLSLNQHKSLKIYSPSLQEPSPLHSRDHYKAMNDYFNKNLETDKAFTRLFNTKRIHMFDRSNTVAIISICKSLRSNPYSKYCLIIGGIFGDKRFITVASIMERTPLTKDYYVNLRLVADEDGSINNLDNYITAFSVTLTQALALIRTLCEDNCWQGCGEINKTEYLENWVQVALQTIGVFWNNKGSISRDRTQTKLLQLNPLPRHTDLSVFCASRPSSISSGKQCSFWKPSPFYQTLDNNMTIRHSCMIDAERLVTLDMCCVSMLIQKPGLLSKAPLNICFIIEYISFNNHNIQHCIKGYGRNHNTFTKINDAIVDYIRQFDRYQGWQLTKNNTEIFEDALQKVKLNTQNISVDTILNDIGNIADTLQTWLVPHTEHKLDFGYIIENLTSVINFF